MPAARRLERAWGGLFRLAVLQPGADLKPTPSRSSPSLQEPLQLDRWLDGEKSAGLSPVPACGVLGAPAFGNVPRARSFERFVGAIGLGLEPLGDELLDCFRDGEELIEEEPAQAAPRVSDEARKSWREAPLSRGLSSG